MNDNHDDLTKSQLIGQRIKAERTKNKNRTMTQTELALKMYTTQNTISNWETGKVVPSMEQFTRLAEIFKCDVSYLLCDYDDRSITDKWISEETGLSIEAVIKLKRLYHDTDGRIPGVVAMRRRFVDLIGALIESDNCEKIFDGIAEYICDASALRIEKDNDLWVEPDEYERVRQYIEASGKVIAFRADVCETSMQTALRLFRETFAALAEKEKAQKEAGNNGKH